MNYYLYSNHELKVSESLNQYLENEITHFLTTINIHYKNITNHTCKAPLNSFTMYLLNE